jgi:3-oxoacyl-[acyl-carrier protein] reductase
LIGACITERLVAGGWRVVAIDRNAVTVPGAAAYEVDVANPAAVAVVASQVRDTHPTVDCLIHAAALTGRSPGPDRSGKLADLRLDVWDEYLRVNLTSALICVQAFLEQLRCSSTPRILLIGSIQGLVPTVGSGGYGVAKVALAGLARQLAAELAPEGVCVNLLSPGPIADLTEQARLGESTTTAATPAGRYGTPEEVAGAVALLLDDTFSYMTGAVIPLDGGEHLRPRHAPPRSHKIHQPRF